MVKIQDVVVFALFQFFSNIKSQETHIKMFLTIFDMVIIIGDSENKHTCEINLFLNYNAQCAIIVSVKE